MVYRFKIAFEDYEEIYRVIDVKSTQNFEELHNAIQQAFGFDAAHPASFFISDDYWRKGEEIVLKNSSEQSKKIMSKSKVVSFIEDPHQKIVYFFDSTQPWTFYVELIKILTEEPKVVYPLCTKSVGTSKKQYKAVVVPPPATEDEVDSPEDNAREDFHPEEEYETGGEDEDSLTEGEDEQPKEDVEPEEGADPEFHESED